MMHCIYWFILYLFPCNFGYILSQITIICAKSTQILTAHISGKVQKSGYPLSCLDGYIHRVLLKYKSANSVEVDFQDCATSNITQNGTFGHICEFGSTYAFFFKYLIKNHRLIRLSRIKA